MTDFLERNRTLTAAMAADEDLKAVTADWMTSATPYEYTYHFTWLGLPIIQYPQDMLAVQEIVWSVKPQLIIETGIDRGGSLIYSASLLQLIGGDGVVVGIDVDIREPNRRAIEAHPLAHRIRMIEGSAIDPEVVAQAAAFKKAGGGVVVLLDSHHTHDHVLRELELYSPLVEAGGYIVVFDTIIEHMPSGSYPDRDWDIGNNPATAVDAFLSGSDRFEVDRDIDAKLLISMAPGGYLKCVR